MDDARNTDVRVDSLRIDAEFFEQGDRFVDWQGRNRIATHAGQMGMPGRPNYAGGSANRRQISSQG